MSDKKAEMAKSLLTETRLQGSKLEKLDDNMAGTEKNVDKAVVKLVSARDNQKKA